MYFLINISDWVKREKMKKEKYGVTTKGRNLKKAASHSDKLA